MKTKHTKRNREDVILFISKPLFNRTPLFQNCLELKAEQMHGLRAKSLSIFQATKRGNYMCYRSKLPVEAVSMSQLLGYVLGKGY